MLRLIAAAMSRLHHWRADRLLMKAARTIPGPVAASHRLEAERVRALAQLWDEQARLEA